MYEDVEGCDHGDFNYDGWGEVQWEIWGLGSIFAENEVPHIIINARIANAKNIYKH